MATTLTLAQLRQEIGANLGEADVTGTITSPPSTFVIDHNRWDLDGVWNQGYLQDTTVTGGSIARISNWTQSVNQFALFSNVSGSSVVGNSYEVHKVLSFAELRRAINRGITMCGPGLRTLVRDETQTVQPSIYQYTPNYNAATTNAFFPQGVVRVEVQWDLGQPTAPWIQVNNWDYLDDFTIQFSYEDVNFYTGNPLRFTGYGPITNFITSDDPTLVIGTFDDDFLIESLVWASTHHAWLMAASKKSTGENKEELEMSQIAQQQFEESRRKWNRGSIIKRRIIVPTGVGWTGYSR